MNLPIYKITIDDEYSDGEDLGIEQIAFTSNPAIMVKGMAFSTNNKQIKFSDDNKMRIAAPALIPGLIYRNDNNEYYVEFTIEEIEAIHNKFMANLTNIGKFNLEHNQAKEVPAFILETWIVDNPKEDKSYSTFGIEVPKGTMFIIAQITDKNYYNELIKNDQLGFSIEGFLGLKLSEIKNKNKEMTQKFNVNGPSAYVELPVGVHNIGGKIYTIAEKIENEGQENEYRYNYIVTIVPVDPSAVVVELNENLQETKEEIKEETKEEKMNETPETTEEVKEEVKMAEGDQPTVEETTVTETTETTGSYTKEEVDAKLNEIYSMIADLKSKIEINEPENAEEVTEVELSIHQKFAKAVTFGVQ